MKKIFIDTNIIVDVLSDRKPYSSYSIPIFQKAEALKYQLYASSHSIATTHYLLKRYVSEEIIRDLLLKIMSKIQVIPVDEQILKTAFLSKHKDFEDAIQIACALSIPKMDCIVTRNVKDFKLSTIPVYSPDQLN